MCGPNPKQDDKKNREIRALLADPAAQAKDIAARYGVSGTMLASGWVGGWVGVAQRVKLA